MWAGRVISISLLVCSQGVFMSGQFLSSSVSWEATKYIENNSVKNNFIFAFKLSCGPFRLYLYLLGALSPGWELTLCTVLNSDLPTVCCALTSRGLLKKVHSKHFCRHFIKHKKLDWGLRWQRKLFPSTGPHCCSLAWWILFRCLFFLQSQCHHYTSVVRSLPPQHLCTANSWMLSHVLCGPTQIYSSYDWAYPLPDTSGLSPPSSTGASETRFWINVLLGHSFQTSDARLSSGVSSSIWSSRSLRGLATLR